MPLNVRRILVTDKGEPVPDTDTRLYNHKCEMCGSWYRQGVARHAGRFLCLSCLDDVLAGQQGDAIVREAR